MGLSPNQLLIHHCTLSIQSLYFFLVHFQYVLYLLLVILPHLKHQLANSSVLLPHFLYCPHLLA